MTGQATDSQVIPGLIGITEESDSDGKTRFIFEIEDGKEDQFYAAFGLQTGDTAGFQRVLIDSIEMLIDRAAQDRHSNVSTPSPVP
jgi:hypothetical protein